MIKNTRFIIAYLLITVTGLYINLHSDITVPMNKSFSEFPLDYKGWQMVSETKFDEDVLNKLKPSDYILRKYIGSERLPVYLYIGYHSGGKDSGEIHSRK